MNPPLLVQEDGQSISLADKVSFLEQPSSYPSHPKRVDSIETHMAWVFLTDRHAWKLKKPVQTRYLDFGTVDSRKRDCIEELRLNQPLAPGVYLDIVPLTIDQHNRLQLGGTGRVLDWLVQMRRLRSDRMLDTMIQSGSLNSADLRPAAVQLAQFYKSAPPVGLTSGEYQNRLAASIQENERDLRDDSFQITEAEARSLASAQLNTLARLSSLLDERIEAGRIIEAHGDLRPEHICLEPKPVIIDRLEFSRELRILDTISDLAFLGLECHRLGSEWVGRFFLESYRQLTRDQAPPELLTLYRCWHAFTRAKIALWHLHDASTNALETCRKKARWYLDQAAAFNHPSRNFRLQQDPTRLD